MVAVVFPCMIPVPTDVAAIEDYSAAADIICERVSQREAIYKVKVGFAVTFASREIYNVYFSSRDFILFVWVFL